MKALKKIYTALILIFLYAPILVLIMLSFNTSKDTVNIDGLTLNWYNELIHNTDLIGLFGNTLLIACLSSVISGIIGTMAAIGICRMRKRMANFVLSITNIPMTNPDIVTGVSMALLFVFVGSMIRQDNILGFGTLLIAHITFELPYVILSVIPKMRQMDPNLTHAAQDLGCTPVEAFFKVEWPQIVPGIASGVAMAFALSLDDFVISYFVYGSSFSTLPIEIYNYTKKPMPPTIYALFTVIFACILLLLVLKNVFEARQEKRLHRNVMNHS